MLLFIFKTCPYSREDRVFVQSSSPDGQKEQSLCALCGKQVLESVVISDPEVRRGSEITPEIVHQMKPDTVIVATGICPFIPEVTGIKGDNVVLAQEVLEEKASLGDTAVVIGAERVGCEVAEFLADTGKKVTIMRQGDEIAGDSPVQYQSFICSRVASKGLKMMPGVRYQEIRDNGIVVRDRHGSLITVPADSIVIVAGSRPNDELLNLLEGKHPNVHRVGDCVEPRDIKAAISEGYEIAPRL